MERNLSTKILYIFKSYRRGVYFYPHRDLQLESPVDWCVRCGGEIYRFDPVEWNEGPVLCPVCRRAEEKERENRNAQ